MPVFIRPGNHRDRLREQQQSQLSLGEFAKLGFERGLHFSPSDSLRRVQELNAAEQGDSPILSPDEATQRYGIEGALSFNEPTRERVAEIKKERKEIELRRDELLSTAEGMLENGVSLGADLFAAMLDPINLGVSFVPVVGQVRYARMAQRLGKGRARVNRGLLEGAVGTALVEPLIVGAAYQEDSAYTMMDSFLNVTFGSVLGGGLHFVGGKAADFFSHTSPQVHEQALRTAVHQAIEGKPIQVEPIVKPSEPPPEAIKMYQTQETKQVGFSEDPELQALIQQKGELHDQLDALFDGNEPAFKNTEYEINLLETKIDELTGQINTKIAEKQGASKPILPSFSDVIGNAGTIVNDRFYKVAKAILKDHDITGADVLNILESFLQAHEGDIITNIAGYDSIELRFDKEKGVLYFVANDNPALVGVILSKDGPGNSFHIAKEIAYGQFDHYESALPDPSDPTNPGPDPFGAEVSKLATAKQTLVTDSPVMRYDARQVDFDSHEAVPLDLLTKKGNQLGSNAGYEAIDPHGKHFYVKPKLEGEDMGQSKIEYLAGLFYKNLDIASPNIHPLADALDDAQWRGVASEMIEDGELLSTSELIAMVTKNPEAFDSFMKGIGVDMWLANWDVAVTGNSVLKDNVVHRIDFGGTMIYRAQGSLKQPEDFNEFVNELKTFQDANKNAYGAIFDEVMEVHSDVFWFKHVSDSLFRLRFINDEQIYKLVTSLGLEPEVEGNLIKSLIARRDYLLEYQDKISHSYGFDAPVDLTVVKGKKEVFSLMEAHKVLDKIHELSAPKLTSPEVNKLKAYQHNSAFVNAYLRKGLADTGQSVETEKSIKILDSATMKWEAHQDGVLWRSGIPVSEAFGIQLTKGTKFADELQELLGKVYTDPGFMGTSAYPKMGKNFDGGPYKVIMKIHYRRGQRMAIPSKISGGFMSESEVVLPRNTSLRIVQVYNNYGGSSPIVVAEIVGDQPMFMSAKGKLNASAAYKQYVQEMMNEEPLSEEAQYTLRDAFNLENTDDIMGQVETEMKQLEEELLESEVDTEAFDAETLKEFGFETLDDISKDFNETVKLAKAHHKGMVASVACVVRKS